jgi:hypothetical protein
MNSLAYNESNKFNAIDMENNEATVSKNKHQCNEIQGHQQSKLDEVHHSDISTASYIRGYN